MANKSEYWQKYKELNGDKIRKQQAEYRKINKEKKDKDNLEYRSKNKSSRRDKDLQRLYGITLADYDKMYISQNGCCAICKIHQSEDKLTFCVDHCHITGKVRGLLCSKCNKAIGLFKDKIELLQKAINYLNGE